MSDTRNELGPLGLDLLSKKLIFVTGKGGVGKSSMTAALARLSSRAGLKTLLCEVDSNAGDASSFLGLETCQFKPKNVLPNLYVMAMNTEEALAEYLRLNLKIPLITKLGPLAKAFDFVANAAPGVKEILIMGKLCYEVREENWDIIWVDASVSGHIVSQLASPAGIADLVKIGLVKEQTDWMSEILSDPKRTSLVVVVTPEETPVLESLELIERIRSETEISVTMCVVNKVFAEPFSFDESRVFEEVYGGSLRSQFLDALGESATDLLEISRLSKSARASRARHTADLISGLDRSIATIFIPFLIGAENGTKLTLEMAEALVEELSGK